MEFPHPQMFHWLPCLVVGSALVSAACQPNTADSARETAPSRPVLVFPPAEELSKLPSLPPPAEALPGDALTVEEWATATPADNDDTAAYDDPSPWGRLAREAVAAQPATTRLSPALRCAAAEVTRFYIEKGAFPAETLRRFLVAKCGGSTPDTIALVLGFDVPAAMTEAQIHTHIDERIAASLATRLRAPGHHALGVAVARGGGRFAIAALVGADEVRLAAGPHTADASRHITLRGTLRDTANAAAAYINRGDYGTDRCDGDPSIALPDFAFSCALDEHDSAAWVEIVTQRKGRVLTDSVAALLVADRDVATIPYRAHPSGPPSPVSDRDSFSSTLVSEINRVRSQDKLPALALERKQSAESTRLVGTFIDATLKGTQDADRIALGLVAGWNVAGLIRAGDLFVALVPTTDATAWLDYALQRPIGRRVLLAPSVDRLAIGPAVSGSGQGALAAIVTTYSMFASADHTADAQHMWMRIAAARARLRVPPLRKIDGGDELRRETQLVLSGAREPSLAVRAAMQSLADSGEAAGSIVSGYTVETTDLDAAEVPPLVVHSAKGALAVAVTHHRVTGAAWGQYVVMYLLVEPVGAASPSVEM
jgi:hypothetical protein